MKPTQRFFRYSKARCGAHFLHGGLLKSSHEIFESVKVKDPHRERSGMDEAVGDVSKTFIMIIYQAIKKSSELVKINAKYTL